MPTWFLQQAISNVKDHDGPRIADVNEVVHRRATDIHGDAQWIVRHEFALFLRPFRKDRDCVLYETVFN